MSSAPISLSHTKLNNGNGWNGCQMNHKTQWLAWFVSSVQFPDCRDTEQRVSQCVYVATLQHTGCCSGPMESLLCFSLQRVEITSQITPCEQQSTRPPLKQSLIATFSDLRMTACWCPCLSTPYFIYPSPPITFLYQDPHILMVKTLAW